MEKWRKFNAGMKWSTRLLFLVGLVLFSYPIYSQAYAAFHQSHVVHTYETTAAKKTLAQQASAESKADAENEKIRERSASVNGHASKETLQAMVDLNTKLANETKVIADAGKPFGVLSIPVLGGLRLPMYEGVSNDVLSSGAGLVPGTSIPQADKQGVHTVLTAHSGLPNTKLFTDLVKMKKGDRFYIEINGKTLTYRVNRIDVVKPKQLGRYFKLDTDQNLVTLLTCTPVGVNSHRLLVQGVQITTEDVPKSSVRAEWMWAGLLTAVIAGTTTYYVRLLMKRLKNSEQ
jgi:sortase A